MWVVDAEGVMKGEGKGHIGERKKMDCIKQKRWGCANEDGEKNKSGREIKRWKMKGGQQDESTA